MNRDTNRDINNMKETQMTVEQENKSASLEIESLHIIDRYTYQIGSQYQY